MSDPAQLSMAYPGPSKRKDLKKKKAYLFNSDTFIPTETPGFRFNPVMIIMIISTIIFLALPETSRSP